MGGLSVLHFRGKLIIFLTFQIHVAMHFVFQTMALIYWSSLPGMARNIKWPVKIEDWGSSGTDVTVYCKSDNV